MATQIICGMYLQHSATYGDYYGGYEYATNQRYVMYINPNAGGTQPQFWLNKQLPDIPPP